MDHADGCDLAVQCDNFHAMHSTHFAFYPLSAALAAAKTRLCCRRMLRHSAADPAAGAAPM